MSWAEIKKSINSDIQKPLDVLINGSKGLVASDNLYYKIQVSDIIISGYDTATSISLGKSITFNWTGSVRLKYKLYNATNSDYAQLKIYKNGTLAHAIYGVKSEPADYQYTDLDLTKGAAYTFVVSNLSGAGANNTLLKGLSIYADLIDLSGITVEVI